MATTGKNFVSLSSTGLPGSGLTANGVLMAVSAAQANSISASGLGTILDRITIDLAKAGYSKNGAVILQLTASTPVTVDLTSLGSVGVAVGDLSFAKWYQLIPVNLGAAGVAIGPGASNPATLPLGGSSPTFTVLPSAPTVWTSPTGTTVDSTHKTIKIDPGGSNGTLVLLVGGS